MSRTPTFFALVALVACLNARDASAQLDLRNDGFAAGGTVVYVQGLAIGEMAAVRLVAPEAGRTLERVALVFGGATGTRTVTLHVWADTGALDPGTELYVGDFQLNGLDGTVQELDVSSAGIVLPLAFRIGVELNHTGAPTIARDTDATILTTANFVYATAAWSYSTAYSLVGDFVIRAVVSSTVPVDGGVIEPPCASGGGCGCGVNPRRPTSVIPLVAASLALGLRRRRREAGR